MADPTRTSLDAWVGTRQDAADPMPAFPAIALAALLDREPVAEALPLPWHWLYALPTPVAGATGPDGHPARGAFLPPVNLPRRMWAASEITVTRPLRTGVPAARTSTIAEIAAKSGRSGPLVFVTVDHGWHQAGTEAIRERQSIVYRGEGSTPAPAAPAAPDPGSLRRTLVPDPVMLFRYSALTYNAHRIHYDLPYATEVEGYRGLVVHGPLIATLLIDAAAPLVDGRQPTRFSFRAERPAFAGEPLLLHAREDGTGIALWSTDEEGRPGMRARLEFDGKGPRA